MNEGISAENESSNRRKRAPLDEENRQIAKTGLQELGLPAERLLKHLIRVGEVIVRGNRDFHRPEGMSRQDTLFWLDRYKEKYLNISQERFQEIGGSSHPPIDETYRIAPGMLEALKELLNAP
ncbi:MAG TPA: hypothetical protein VIY49_39935 [Bryobacteraceae bacterium]